MWKDWSIMLQSDMVDKHCLVNVERNLQYWHRKKVAACPNSIFLNYTRGLEAPSNSYCDSELQAYLTSINWKYRSNSMDPESQGSEELSRVGRLNSA
jgi:hypothetical protein